MGKSTPTATERSSALYMKKSIKKNKLGSARSEVVTELENLTDFFLERTVSTMREIAHCYTKGATIKQNVAQAALRVLLRGELRDTLCANAEESLDVAPKKSSKTAKAAETVETAEVATEA